MRIVNKVRFTIAITILAMFVIGISVVSYNCMPSLDTIESYEVQSVEKSDDGIVYTLKNGESVVYEY